MSASVQYATTTPTIPPITASSTDSVRSWVMSCLRVAPSERRTAISSDRPAPRARSRFAMLAQAMSSTIPVMPKSSFIGLLDSPCTELWPRRPSVTVSSFALNCFIRWSLIPSWSGASTSLMIGW